MSLPSPDTTAPAPLIHALDKATEPYSGKAFFHAFLAELGRQLGDLGELGRRFDAELNLLGVPSSRDEALGLLGQSAFLAALSLEFQRTQRHGRPLSILMLAIDQIDQLSADAASEVLYSLAAVLRGKLRNSDLICRLANEGFVVVLPETGTLGAKDASEKIREAVEMHDFSTSTAQESPRMTCAIGLAVVSGIERSHEEILALADRALSEARAAGGNRICSAIGIV